MRALDEPLLSSAQSLWKCMDACLQDWKTKPVEANRAAQFSATLWEK